MKESSWPIVAAVFCHRGVNSKRHYNTTIVPSETELLDKEVESVLGYDVSLAVGRGVTAAPDKEERDS